MTFRGRFATTLLFLGDIVAFIASLWITLLIRYGRVPGEELFTDHLTVFGALFALWLLVFYMAGLYGKRVLFSKTTLLGTILRTQLLNTVLAALFFFLLPGLGIAPKTNLLLYLFVSLALILFWRLTLFPLISRPASREHAALIAEGPEADALLREVNENPRYRVTFSLVMMPRDLASHGTETLAGALEDNRVSLLVVDTGADSLRPLLPKLYDLAFVGRGHPLVDFHDLYEEVFDRVPLSLVEYDWFLRNVSAHRSGFYEAAKRLIDIVGGIFMGIITVILTPVLALLMRLEGPGPVFISQERIGRFGKVMTAYKFRSMRVNKAASKEWTVEEKKDNPVTKVGAFLRRTSLDEFPQFVNVLRGELSLVGPRNDILGLGRRLGEEISYYDIRYIVTPGITGWAQINQQYEQGNISPQSVEETKTRLAYDFYYIKHRSLALDIVIALKTVKRMLFRVAT